MEYPSTECDYHSKNTLEVKSGENVCDINVLFGELKSQGENQLLSTERVMVYDKTSIFFYGFMTFCHYD